jgi:hypothetical protein
LVHPLRSVFFLFVPNETAPVSYSSTAFESFNGPH